MRKYLPHIIVSVFLLTIFAGSFDFASAQASGNSRPLTPEETQELQRSRVEASQGTLGKAFFWVLSQAGYVLLTAAGAVTALGAIVLNASVYHTIVNMASSINSDAITSAWTVIRDLANMGFIFMLLFAAIMTIIGREKNARDLVVKMVIAAILINFSLFFTKVIIDVANILATTFYAAIAPDAGADFLKAGLSNGIVAELGIQTLWNAKDTLGGSTLFISTILSSVALLITAFVFFAMAIMLVVRFVVLIFVMILSPLMVLAGVFPAIKEYSDQWWKALLNQAFFAPVFFILMWVTLTLIDGVNDIILGKDVPPNFAGVGSADFSSGLAPTIINYLVIIAFIISTLLISKKIADRSGDAAKGLNKWALGVAGGASFGVAGRIGRGTIGRVGAALGENEKLKGYAEKGGASGMTARLALVAGRKTAGASFDVRGSAIGGELGAGKAETGGYSAYIKKKSEEEEKFASSLAPSAKIKAKATASAKQAENTYKEAVETHGEDSDQAKSARIKMDEAKKNKDTIHGNKDEVEKAVKDSDNAMKKEISDLNNSEELKAKETEERSAYDTVSRLEAEVVAAEGATKDEKIVQLAAAKEKLKEIKTEAGVIRQKIKTETENITRRYEEEKKKIKETEIKPAGDIRKENFANVTENSIWARAMGYNYEAAAKIRKGNKKAEDLVKDLMKATGEIKDEKKDEKKDENSAEEKDKK